MVEIKVSDKTIKRKQEKEQLLGMLQEPDGQISTTMPMLSYLLGIGDATLRRELIHKRGINLPDDPLNPTRCLITSGFFQLLKNNVEDIKTTK